MHKFKKGDVVRATRDTATLTEGEEYEVLAINQSGSLRLAQGNYIPDDRFELVKPNQEEAEDTMAKTEAVAEALDKAVGKQRAVKQVDVKVERTGEKLVIPDNMEYGTAIAALQRRAEAEEKEVSVSHVFRDMTVPEGMVAFTRTLQEMFGFVNAVDTPGFWSDTPPEFKSLEIAPGETMQVPWGSIAIPGVSGRLMTSFELVGKLPRFKIAGQVKGKHTHVVDQVARRMREYQAEHSIYRGKAIYAQFPDLEEGVSLEDFFPTFMLLPPKLTADDLIFAAETAELVETSLFTPIEHTDACRANKISLKRGVLLEGPFGVGKTLTATVTAKKCVENGWTFIYLKEVEHLERAIEFAKSYQPAVIFAEDIDQVLLEAEGRDEAVNGILNSIDGVDSKNLELITVLTTNNLESITQAFLRPGRLDSIVSVRAPDAHAAERLVRLFAGKLLTEGTDLTTVGELLQGCIPAMIREVVERSKLSAIRRTPLRIEVADLLIAGKGMLNHMKLLEPKKADTRSEVVKAASEYGAHLGAALAKVAEAKSSTKNGLAGSIHVQSGTVLEPRVD